MADTLMAAVISSFAEYITIRDLAANIPAAPTDTQVGKAILFIATDSGAVSVWNGTAWQTIASAPTGANPTATAGPTVINGISTHFMRADAAPALSPLQAFLLASWRF